MKEPIIMNWQEYITADPAVLVGKPVIRGTRLAVEFILGIIAQGWPEDEIMRNYHVTKKQVRACFASASHRPLTCSRRWRIIFP